MYIFRESLSNKNFANISIQHILDLCPCNALPAHQSIYTGLLNGGTGKTNVGSGSDYLTETHPIFSFCTLKIFLYEEGYFTGAFTT